MAGATMSRSWTVGGKSQSEVKTLLEKHLAEAQIPSFATVSWEGNVLKVSLAKAGKSHFTMALESAGSGTIIRETDRSVSFVHKPFVSVVESFVNSIMDKVTRQA
jgi:hypothetical protein